MKISFTPEQIQQAKRVIRDYFPGQTNKGLRRLLDKQLRDQLLQLELLQLEDEGRGILSPQKIELGYGVLFLGGSGDARTIDFNEKINQALGLI